MSDTNQITVMMATDTAPRSVYVTSPSGRRFQLAADEQGVVSGVGEPGFVVKSDEAAIVKCGMVYRVLDVNTPKFVSMSDDEWRYVDG